MTTQINRVLFEATPSGVVAAPASDAPPAAEAPVETTELPSTETIADPAPTQTAPLPRPTPVLAPLPGPSELNRPFIQVGAFAVAENASKLQDQLQGRGYPVRTSALQGRTRILTRVLVGPAQTELERDALLQRLRNDGYTDVLITSQ